MPINYTELKEAMADLGFAVSQGDEWTANDSLLYRQYLYLNQTNITSVIGNQGLAYTGLLPDGFPGKEVEPVPPGPEAELVTIEITGNVSVDVGATSQLKANGVYDDGGEQDITEDVTWSSDNELVFTVSSAGLVTGVAAGTADVSAVLDLVDASTPIMVDGGTAVVTEVKISGTATVEEGNTTQLTATATYSDGVDADVTADAAWTSGDEETAMVSASGLVTGVAAGEVGISVVYEEQGDEFTVTVTSAG